MPAVDSQSAIELDRAFEAIFNSRSSIDTSRCVQELFVERLDFARTEPRAISLHGQGLPPHAQLIADRENVHVAWVNLLEAGRVPAAQVQSILREVRRTVQGDLLLVAADRDRSQVHLVYPADRSGREVLRRMVARRGEPRRTVVEQLEGVYRAVAAGGDLRRALESAYDVEAVTKRFFKEYAAVFDRVMRAIEPTLPDHEQRKLFCQMLFNRLMFVYFLQRKGWLTFNGNRDYLRALWTDAQDKREANFYASRLQILFFSGLNAERTPAWDTMRTVVEPLIGRVPFLNGGLFARDELDDLQGVSVPDEAVRSILFDLFERFNFTVAESTPYDIEVAVDPEMLGKVFEELVTGRHETGSYYTPRQVVSFMCREALKAYLRTRVAGLSPESVVAFVEGHTVSGMNVQQARLALEAMQSLAAVDPACGSGAYLVGLLHELVELQRLLYSSSLIQDAKSLYDLKLQIIERNLYGVDIDPFAVNVAMLRLWLSLVIEYDGPGEPPALPNLDFKIRCGDSLLAPDPQPALQDNMFRERAHSLAVELSRLKADYLRTPGETKAAVGRVITQVEVELKNNLQFAPAPPNSVDWSVQFAEAFDRGGGFDIVLTNPPYVRQELIGPLKLGLRSVYPTIYTGTADLYCYFYARALQLLRSDGILAFISSNKWFRTNYGAKLREVLAASCRVHSITDFGFLPVFDSAVAYPMVFVAQKGISQAEPPILTRVPSLSPPYPDVEAVVARYGITLSEGALVGPIWDFEARPASPIVSTSPACQLVPVNEYVQGRIYYGVKTGLNEAFIIDGACRAELVARDPGCTSVIRPLAAGRDIGRWSIAHRDRWLIFARRGIEIDRFPSIKEFLGRYRPQLEPRPRNWPVGREWPGRKPGSYKWYEIQDEVAYYKMFDLPKIVYQVFQVKPAFAYDPEGTVANNAAYIIPTEDLYLLGTLNSTSCWHEISQHCSQIRGGYQLIRDYFERVMIPIAKPQEKLEIGKLVDKCIKDVATGRDVSSLEGEIDDRVARLYGAEANP